MKLHSEFVGSGRSIAFLHGFTQTGRSWQPVLDAANFSMRAQLLDAPGHGSTQFADRDLSQIALDIVETISPGVLVGYSMGARMALHAALTRSTKISALCLISGTAGLETQEEREQRVQQDNDLATRIENIGVPAFIDEWLANPLFEGLNDSTNQRDDRLRNSATGLATSLRMAGTGTQLALWDTLHTITIPVLIIAGERDTKFVNLAHKLAANIVNSELHVMHGVGHTAHLEDPHRFVEILESWLSKCDEKPE
jgi:2-succinyl-6-hydroxy-2,4-cyclohexadiene-1-carboxylate synthase